MTCIDLATLRLSLLLIGRVNVNIQAISYTLRTRGSRCSHAHVSGFFQKSAYIWEWEWECTVRKNNESHPLKINTLLNLRCKGTIHYDSETPER